MESGTPTAPLRDRAREALRWYAGTWRPDPARREPTYREARAEVAPWRAAGAAFVHAAFPPMVLSLARKDPAILLWSGALFLALTALTFRRARIREAVVAVACAAGCFWAGVHLGARVPWVEP